MPAGGNADDGTAGVAAAGAVACGVVADADAGAGAAADVVGDAMTGVAVDCGMEQAAGSER